VKLAGNAQMVIDLCHVQLAISVNMESPTVHPVSRESTARMVHLCVCRVLLEKNVWTLVLSQRIVLMELFLGEEQMFVSCVHRVTRPHQAGLFVYRVQKAFTALIQVIHQYHVLLACTLWEEDLKTAQHVQLETLALTLLVHLWLVLEVNIYWLLKLQSLWQLEQPMYSFFSHFMYKTMSSRHLHVF